MIIVGRTAERAKKAASTPNTDENSLKPTEAKKTPKKAQGKASKKN